MHAADCKKPVEWSSLISILQLTPLLRPEIQYVWINTETTKFRLGQIPVINLSRDVMATVTLNYLHN